jgi:hypothetical protein
MVMQTVFHISFLLQAIFSFVTPPKQEIKPFLSLASVCSAWYQTFRIWFPYWSRSFCSFRLQAKSLATLSSYALSCIGKLKILEGRTSLAMLDRLPYLTKVYIRDFARFPHDGFPINSLLTSLSIGSTGGFDVPSLPYHLTCLKLGDVRFPLHFHFRDYIHLTRLEIDCVHSLSHLHAPPNLTSLSLPFACLDNILFDPLKLTHLECRYDLLTLPYYSSFSFPNLTRLTTWYCSPCMTTVSGAFFERMPSLTYLALKYFYDLSRFPSQINVTHLELVDITSAC